MFINTDFIFEEKKKFFWKSSPPSGLKPKPFH